VSPDRRSVAVSTGASVTVLDVATRQPVSRYVPEPYGAETGSSRPTAVGCLGWSAAPTRLVVCNDELDSVQGATVVDPRSGTPVGSTILGVPPQALETSADGSAVAVVAGPFHVPALVVLDARTLEVRQFVSLPTTVPPTDVSFSPDGRRIAVAGGDGLVVVDTRTWRATRAPAPLTGEVLQAEWFPDDRTLAVAGPAQAVYLFDVLERRVTPLQVPTAGDAARDDVRLVPGISDELVVLGGDGGGRRYPLDPAAWTARACEVAGRDLTREEWARYVPDRAYRATCSDLG
jgi:dipeptidyl aminopeptidase/acylaminoacyl peptidase